MGRIKSFLKKDSNILRDTVILLFSLTIGIYKLFFQMEYRLKSIIIGLLAIAFSIVLAVDIVREFKRLVK